MCNLKMIGLCITAGVTAVGTTLTEVPASEPVVAKLIAHAVSDVRLPHTFATADYALPDKHSPIGVFDSGIGGLTVLEAILGLDAFSNETLQPKPDGRPDFEGERFIYLGDQANMPYGNYPASGREDFLRELILKDTVFLLGRRYWPSSKADQPSFDKPPIKAVVIACNTATAYGMADIRNAMSAWKIGLPVIGVVEAGARGVGEQIRDADERRAVGVLATVGTCSSQAYPKAIASTIGLAGKRVPAVVQQGCLKLAGAIETDPMAVAGCIREDVRALVENHRQSGEARPLDTIVLGCTHFPLVQEEIRTELRRLRQTEENGLRPFEKWIAEEIAFVNPAELTAKELFRELARSRLRQTGPSKDMRDRFYISVASPTVDAAGRADDGGLTQEFKYGRTVGKLDIEDTRFVPMTVELLPKSSLTMIQDRLPHVWNSLSEEASSAGR